MRLRPRSGAPGRPDRHPLALGAAVADFLARPDLSLRSRTVYGQTLGRLLTDLGTQSPVAELSGADLTAFLERHHGHAAPATWNLNLAALRSFLTYCRRHGALEADPSAVIERRKVRTNPDQRVIPILCSGRYCLHRSLATTLLCRIRGTWPTWCTGVRTPPFAAHAWVEAEGHRVGEPESTATYRTMLTVPPT